MYRRAFSNKDLFANVVLLLMSASLFADMAFPGEGHTIESSGSNRMLCHAIQLLVLGSMSVFVCCNYTLPRIPAVGFWELSLVAFLSLSALHAVFISDREQLIAFSKYVYWPIGYFFFRILADDVREYAKRLLFLLVCLSVFAVWYYVSQSELRAELVETAGNVSSNVGWKLISIFAVSLCLIVVGDRRGYAVGAAALLLIPFSLKRGAILAEAVLCVSLVLASYRLGRLHDFIRRNAKWITVIALAWLVFCVSQLQVVIERFSSLKDDGGSGRLQFYPLLFQRWSKADFGNWLCGFGFWSTPKYLENVWIDQIYAHSDILEMLHDYGAVGILSYLMILAGLIVLFRHTWRLRDDGVIIAGSILSLFFVAGIMSGNVMFRETVYLMIPMGYMTGRLEKSDRIWRLEYEAPGVKPHILHNPELSKQYGSTLSRSTGGDVFVAETYTNIQDASHG